jgi:hypothetical protein
MQWLPGAHNFEYATKIMNQAGKDLGEVKASIRQPGRVAGPVTETN